MITQEEAIKILNDEEIKYLVRKFHRGKEALDIVLSALHPVSREQVEKVWRGEWIMHDDELGLTCECSRCHIETMGNTPFCPACGAPMTGEAVDMVMKRLEALKDADD